MRNFKYLAELILIIIFVSFEVRGVTAQPGNLTFEIELEKDTFLVREPIWVDLYFTNKGNENITLDCLDLCWQILKVHLVNSAGDTLEYCGYIADGICSAGPTVKPSETYEYYINLSKNFGKGAREYLPPSLRYFEEDTYTLQMTHSGVLSNLIKLKIESPKGSEKSAYKLVKEASRDAFNYYLKDTRQVIDILQKLINEFPGSVYADWAYYEIAGLYGLIGQPEKTHAYLRQLLLNYPNSHFALKAFPGMLQQMTTDEKIKFLKEIIKTHPKTRAFDWAKKSLEGLEGKEKSKE